MKAIETKLVRDLRSLKGQVVTIALVVACGIASYVSLGTNWRSLQSSRLAYYEEQRFADVFAHARRAPEPVRERIEEIPGVARAMSRLVETIMLPMEDMAEPAIGRVVSISPSGEPELNAVYLRSGRWIEPGRSDEAILLDTFAKAHGIAPGDTVPAVVNGKLRRLRVVGLALSPEYLFAVAPGDLFANDRRFAVLWMDRAVLAPAFQMEGAFDDVALSLQPGASAPAVLDAVDRILAPYGGTGAYAQEKQPSDFALRGELAQLESMATVIPAIFLAVAAYLLNVVLARLVQLQRTEIAVLKALGYTDLEVGLHYLKLVSVIVVLGAAIGVGGGAWLGRGMVDLYAQYFRFPEIRFTVGADVIATSLVVSLGAAFVGGLATVRSVARLPPAEAMQPPAPPTYRASSIERLGLGRLLAASERIVLREVARRPLRTTLSALGIAFAVGILVVGRFSSDAIETFMDVQFYRAQREDVLVTFTEPLPERAIRSVAHLPGVVHAEGMRVVPVRVRSGHRFRDTAITALPDGATLRALVDRTGHEAPLPEQGVVVERLLATALDASVGDELTAEVLDGERQTITLTIAGLTDSSLGLPMFMRLPELSRRLGEEPRSSSALLAIDPSRADALSQDLKRMPKVAGVARRDGQIRQFQEQSGQTTGTTTAILTAFAAIIAVSVVYNNARVSLSTRGRELASLRVLGFSRAEVSGLLLAELAVQVGLGVPPGLWLGRVWADAVMSTVDPETYRFPVVIAPQTYAFAVLVVLCAAAASALVVRRRVDRLDLISVLKTRE